MDQQKKAKQLIQVGLEVIEKEMEKYKQGARSAVMERASATTLCNFLKTLTMISKEARTSILEDDDISNLTEEQIIQLAEEMVKDHKKKGKK